MHYLQFDISEGDDGSTTIEALASTGPDAHAAVLAEAQQVLDWAWRTFPHSHAPLDDGGDWDHDLQVSVEGGRWHAVTLTLCGSPAFAAAFGEVFGQGEDD